jgi:hypothetical protein
LGIALHPDGAQHGWVYRYWTYRGPIAGEDGDDGPDPDERARVPRLGHRGDRCVWDGAPLTCDRHLIRLCAFQADADQHGVFNQPRRGNHDGGRMTFGPDGTR